mgnify:CR=1 FL=1
MKLYRASPGKRTLPGRSLPNCRPYDGARNAKRVEQANSYENAFPKTFLTSGLARHVCPPANPGDRRSS